MNVADYATAATADAPATDVFAALTTAAGLAGWWTGLVDGTPGEVGGDVSLRFAGLDEHITLRVDELVAGRTVAWTCLGHTGHPDWAGTIVEFTIAATGDDSSEIVLRHHGLGPALPCYDACRRGWDHFVPSLVAYVETGQGRPYGYASSTRPSKWPAASGRTSSYTA